VGGNNMGMTVTPADIADRRSSDAMSVFGVTPGDYRVYLVQSFHRSEGPGFDVTFTVYTTLY
jgi:hypothetical protein